MNEWMELMVVAIHLLGAMCMDYKKGKVSNYLIISGVICTCLMHWNIYGWKELGMSLIGMMIPLILFYPLFQMKVLGGGDIKLFVMIACLGNLSFFFRVVLAAFLAGAIGSLVKMVRRRELFARMKNLYRNVNRIYIMGLTRYENYAQDQQANVIPFAGAIFLGYLVVMILQILKTGQG